MWTVFWQSIVLATAGTFILRLGGRKSISQMTIPQLAIFVSLGTVLGGQVSSKGVWESILAAATFVGFLVVVEWITLNWNGAESELKGVAIPVIADGQLIAPNLKKLRMSVDDLEKRIRMAGINGIEDIKMGTIENNGELGFKLMPHARPLTLGDLEMYMKANFPQAVIPHSDEQAGVFKEAISGENQQEVLNQLH